MFIVNPYIYASTSYLLDDYPQQFAYSLRQLKTGVTNVVRVRRSSDNAESDFTADEITDGTLTTWTGANDGFVVTLYNQGSVGSSDLTQATAANQPKLVSSGTVLTKGGKPAMSFDGSNDTLQIAISKVYCNYPFSQWIIGSNELSSDDGIAASYREAGGDQEGWLWAINRNTTSEFVVDSGASSHIYDYLSSDNTNSQRLQSFLVDSSGNGSAYLSGTLQETINSMSECTPTNQNLVIGGMILGSFYLTGYVQEFIWSATDESSNRTDIETNINDHYSIY